MKSPTNQFIEDAKAGGWKEPYYISSFNTGRGNASTILLDPLAWQAVGKTRGWREEGTFDGIFAKAQWKLVLHRFIDHLADGKTIDEALAAIQ